MFNIIKWTLLLHTFILSRLMLYGQSSKIADKLSNQQALNLLESAALS
ncbi:hypothetical protein O9929_05130 [Vibrio lentus]|nr:hypothetical protein [Vibrio lentus]